MGSEASGTGTSGDKGSSATGQRISMLHHHTGPIFLFLTMSREDTDQMGQSPRLQLGTAGKARILSSVFKAGTE